MHEDAPAILALAHAVIHAWNAGEGTSFAQLFSEDARYTTGGGVTVAGRDAIARLVDGSAIVLIGSPEILIDGACARVNMVWREGAGSRAGTSILSLVRDGRDWKIVACATEDAR